MCTKSIIVIVTLSTFMSCIYCQYLDSAETCDSILYGCDSERQCVTDITEDDCPADTIYYPTASLCGCCPGCINAIEGKECDKDAAADSMQCAPGYSCTTKGCTKDSKSCPQYGYDKDITWHPSCDADGKFSAVQCKGERATGKCFCYSEDGERIFGEEWWKDAQNMTCACSRKVTQLQQQGRTNITLHCSDDGNFEVLQCDSEICWCADEKTGNPVSVFVPETMMTTLPCYDAAKVGTQYLRQCESMEYAQNVIREKLEIHGTIYAEMPYVNCDRDGSYGRIQQQSSQVFCAWKDKTTIESYYAEMIQKSTMDCRCARDTKYYAAAGFTPVITCSGNGNYPTSWETEDVQYCLDSDGFAISPTFDLNTELDCTAYTV
ncbi:uncharacterized protein LOC126183757 isoform X1 [Schistocerca cancellata]|uniref:uncharacterized protein LOC126183757 isoform X1 n=1 Tax=Schistocerca cancellata TaxID=274614 RepID=UPI00211938E0|nr:uncharacterized protein LOC126183757 isoform X1 [Schistocerca cancellata]